MAYTFAITPTKEGTMAHTTIVKSIPRALLDAYINLGWDIRPMVGASEDRDPIQIQRKVATQRNHDLMDFYEPSRVYLVQRGVINRPLGQYTNERLTQAVNMDYMGSAEFEFGSLPNSLRRIQAQFTRFKTIVLPDILGVLGDRDLKLRLFANFDTEKQQADFIESLKASFSGQNHLKESLYATMVDGKVDLNQRKERYCYADFWWDIRNDVMFSFDKQFMSRLSEHLKASFEYMENQ